MQITSNYPNVSINTANPATEQARRDMQRRELVEPIRETEKGGAERALNADDRTRTGSPATNNVNLYDNNGKESETQQAVARREDEPQSDEQQSSAQQEQQQQAEQQEIRELQARDQEVRAHEQAHATIGGRYAGAPSYEYQQGPDGQRYAVGGEVQIDLSPVPGDPQATIQKMQQVKAAALAPAEPSAADRSIAVEASRRGQQAQAELIAETAEKVRTVSQPDNGFTGSADDAPAAENISANVAGMVFPQRERLDTEALMQVRSQVIQNFYQLATEPQQKPLRQQA